MKTIAIALLIVVLSSPSFATTKAVSTEEKMHSMFFPEAPFLTERINVLDVFAWLDQATKDDDPEGVGIRFFVHVPDDRPLNQRNTMDAWSHGNPKNMDENRFPRIIRVRLSDYVRYLITMSGFRISVEEDGVHILEPKR